MHATPATMRLRTAVSATASSWPISRGNHRRRRVRRRQSQPGAGGAGPQHADRVPRPGDPPRSQGRLHQQHSGRSMRAPGDPQSMFAERMPRGHDRPRAGLDPIELRRRNACATASRASPASASTVSRAVEVLDALERESDWGSPLPAGHGRRPCRWACATSAPARRRCVAPAGRWRGRSRHWCGRPGRRGLHRAAQGGRRGDVGRSAPCVVRHSDTSVRRPDPGVGGQRTTHVLGRAAQVGATDMKARLEELAAEAMGWPAGEVRLEEDRFSLATPRPFDEVAERSPRSAGRSSRRLRRRRTNPASRATSNSPATSCSRRRSRNGRVPLTTSCWWPTSAQSSTR